MFLIKTVERALAPSLAQLIVTASARRNMPANESIQPCHDKEGWLTKAWLAWAWPWLGALLSLVVATTIALLVHRAVVLAMTHAARRTSTTTDDILLRRLSKPSRWLLVIFVLSALQPTLALPNSVIAIWQQASGLLIPALLGWLATGLLSAVHDIVVIGTDITVPNNLAARRRRTRAGILHRIALFAVLLITFCMMLISIPSVRSIGVTLIASAGLAGLAVGAAAQPALKNLIAGVQMAFTEPIRIDDVVIMDGEWGRIEEIRLTFVVVRIWDDRRLIVPVSKFLENSFQNWTRETSQLLGTAFLQVDPTADVPRLRAHLEEVVKANPRWDGRVCVLQVTDTHFDHMELRCLVSAGDAGLAFDLRCDVREAMMAFLTNEMPEALPRRRNEVIGAVKQAPLPAPPPATHP